MTEYKQDADHWYTEGEMLTWIAPLETVGTLSLKMDGQGEQVIFNLQPGWNVGLKDKDPLDPVEAELGIGEDVYTLSKEAVLTTANSIGLPPAYVTRTPGVLVATHLNYWTKHLPDTELKFLTKGKEIMTVTKGGIIPFSNVEIEEIVTDHGHFGSGDDGDYLFDGLSHHGIHSTAMRVVDTKNWNEVCGDTWQAGVQVLNSTTGKHPSSIGLYLHNVETKARVIHYVATSKYNRKTMGQDSDVFHKWVKDTADLVLAEIPHEIEILESLKQESIADAVAPVLMDVFKTYKIPLRSRQVIMDNLIESGDLTYYGLVNAIGYAATVEGVKQTHRTALMEVAGAVAHDVSHRCTSCKKVI